MFQTHKGLFRNSFGRMKIVLEPPPFGKRLILNETHKRAVGINKGTNAAASFLGFGRMKTRLPLATRRSEKFLQHRARANIAEMFKDAVPDATALWAIYPKPESDNPTPSTT